MNAASIVTTRRRWFLRGAGVGVLLAAALNALSYFFRSSDGGNLLGLAIDRREALGFPVEIWESGNNYDGYFVDYPALLVNAAFAAVLGVLAGSLLLPFRSRLNRLVQLLEVAAAGERRGNFQFSLRSLLIITCLIGMAAAGARHFIAGRPAALGAIYALGPWVLILTAYLPRRIPWRQRVAIVIPTALLLIAAAVVIGASLNRPLAFDQVLMGIFVCWTPQCTIAAIGVTVAIVVFHRCSMATEDGIGNRSSDLP